MAESFCADTPIRRNVSARRALQGRRGKPELADNAANGFARGERGLSAPRQIHPAKAGDLRRIPRQTPRRQKFFAPQKLGAFPPDYPRARRDKAENIPAESQECDTPPQSARHKNGNRLTGRLSRRARIFFPILAAVAEICTAATAGRAFRGNEIRTYYAPQRFRRLRNPLYLFRKLRGNFIPQTSGFSRHTVSIGNRQD